LRPGLSVTVTVDTRRTEDDGLVGVAQAKSLQAKPP
jgi:hypothetical protein